jgi:hypothetical protein
METLETSSNVSNFVRESYMSHAQSTQKRIVQVQSPKKKRQKAAHTNNGSPVQCKFKVIRLFLQTTKTGQKTNDRYSKQQEYSK